MSLKSLLIRVAPAPVIDRLKRLRLSGAFREFRRTGRVSTFPSFAVIDPGNICNLSCPCCPTGTRQLNQPRSFMSGEDFKKVVDSIPSLRQLSLFNWGEPFLNKRIVPMIAYAAGRGVEVTIHSNFSLSMESGFFEKLVRSGLAALVISLDGAHPDSYARYRRNGDFEKVLANIRQLAAARRESGASLRIVWKFVVNRFNEREIDDARRQAQQLGIEFETALMGLGDDLPDCRLEGDVEARKREWLPLNPGLVRSCYRKAVHAPFQDGPCQELFSSITIGPNGDVYPCCYVTDQRNAFGNLLNEPLDAIWNNEAYRDARNLYVARTPASRAGLVCRACRIYRQDKRFSGDASVVTPDHEGRRKGHAPHDRDSEPAA